MINQIYLLAMEGGISSSALPLTLVFQALIPGIPGVPFTPGLPGRPLGPVKPNTKPKHSLPNLAT